MQWARRFPSTFGSSYTSAIESSMLNNRFPQAPSALLSLHSLAQKCASVHGDGLSCFLAHFSSGSFHIVFPQQQQHNAFVSRQEWPPVALLSMPSGKRHEDEALNKVREEHFKYKIFKNMKLPPITISFYGKRKKCNCISTNRRN